MQIQRFPVAVRGAFAVHRFLTWVMRQALPAELTVADDVLGAARTQMLAEAVRLRIADELEQGPRSASELAGRLGVEADGLHRLLRALAGQGIFRLRGDGRFANNRASRVLCHGHSSALGSFAQYFASQSNVLAWGALGRTLRDGQSAFEHAHGRSVWEWLAENEDEGRTFDRAMHGLSARAADVIAQQYPWQEVSHLCDVGGGAGAVLAALLEAHRHLAGTLCDRADVVSRAESALSQRSLSSRVAFQSADFFQELPGGADVYLLKNILHDWDDARCVQVLSACRRAASPRARVLIAEQFLEPCSTEPLKALSDVQMMVVSGRGRERSQDEYAALLTQAGLTPGRVFRHPLVDLFEARPR
jgi:DNA-binding transcriptional ArsR family regulator